MSAAVDYGKFAILDLLVASGADVNARTSSGLSFLGQVVLNKNYRAIRRLKRYGIRDVPGPDGTTALIVAVEQKDHRMVRLLSVNVIVSVDRTLPSVDGFSALHRASFDGNLDDVRILCKKLGARVNNLTTAHLTPLMLSAHGGHLHVSVWLVKEGAKLRLCSRAGFTAELISTELYPKSKQTLYLTSKTHCSNPLCTETGLKKCTGCRTARYCGEICQLSHWKTHRPNCKLALWDNVSGQKSFSQLNKDYW